MTSLRVLTFDHEGRPVQFDKWLDDLQLYLLSDSKDSVSLFDLASGAATAPPATADSSTRSQTAQALYDAVVARYSSPATADLGRLLLPYLFPELSAFTTVEDLVSQLCASDARYRTAVSAEFLNRNPPPMYITLYFIVTRLPDSLHSIRDHFLSLGPTSLTVDLLEQHLLAAETSAVAVGAARGTPRSPFFEGCSPSPLAPSYASAAAADVSISKDVGAASASAKRRSSKGKGGRGGGGGSGCGGGGSGSGGGGSNGGGGGGGSGGGSGGSGGGGGGSGGSGGSGGGGTGGGGTGAQHLLKSRIAIFDLNFDAILSAMHALSVSAEGDCYLCVQPDPRIAAAALGASESGTLPGTAPAEALHTFTLDSGASRCFFRDSTTLTPLPAPVPVRLADPSGGPVVARSSTALQCPAVPSGSLLGLHLPSFSTNLVSTAALQDAMVTTTTPGGRRVSICTCTRTGRHLATFTRRPGSTLYTLATEPPQVAASAQVSTSGQVAASCSCRLLLHQNFLWHHRLCHPSLPRLCGMHSPLLVSGLPRSLPPVLPSPAPPCLPCVERRQRAAPHSSSFPPTSAPLQTLHMDVWGPARVSGQIRERYFLLVVDDYTQYTMIFPLRCKGQVVDVLIPWIGGEFSSDLLRDFCRGEGILQSFTLPDSPQQNGIAERRIGLVMEGSRASIRNTSADTLSPRAIPYVFLGYVPDAPGWQFYHPTSRRVLSSQDVTFDESGPAPSGVSQVDPPPDPALFQVAVGSGAARGAASGGAASGGAGSAGAETGGAGSEGAEPGGVGTEEAEPAGVEPGGAASKGAESWGVEPQGAALSRGSAGASPRLSLQQLREWFVRRTCLRSGAARAGGAGVAAGASGAGGAATTGPGGARTWGTGAAGTRGVEGAGVVGPGAGSAGGAGAGVGDTRAQVLGTPSSTGLTPLLCPPPDQSQPLLQPASPLPAPSRYTEQSSGLIERREPVSSPVSLVRTARRAPRLRPPPFPGTHAMELRPSSVPLRVPLPAPPESSLPEVPDPESDRARVVSPTVSRLLATAVTDPSFESAAGFALVAELLDFAAACHLDYATALVAESVSAIPPSVGTDVLEDRQEDFECLAVAAPRFASILLAPEGDPDAPDIPTSLSYVEAITGTYVDEVPPPGANKVDGMWIFRVKRPLGSPPAFKARYVARGISQRQGVDYFQTFSPTPKMTTLRVLLHVAVQCDYELHSLDFSAAFLQGSLHEEIWLRRPPGFTGTFPVGTLWSLRRPVYGLRQAPREWHDTLRTTLVALGFAPSTANPSLLLRTDTSLPPFYVLFFVDDLFFATADTEALTLVKSELQKRHTCTDLGELPSYLGLQITRDRARRTITQTRSHMVHQVLQRFGFHTSGLGLMLGGRGPVVLTGLADASWVDDSATQRSSQGNTFSLGSGSVSWRSTRSSLVLSSRFEAEIYVGAMATLELRWLTYLLTNLGEQPRSPPILYVDNKAVIALCQEHRLEHRTKHIALRYFLARELQKRGQLRLAYVATPANTADIFTKALPPA
ncbi:unnamed protein product [Closterium sp. NIES-53]